MMNIDKKLLSIGEEIIEEIILDPEKEPLKRYLFSSVDVTVDNWKTQVVDMIKKTREAIVKIAMASESRHTGRWLKNMIVNPICLAALYTLAVSDEHQNEYAAMDAVYYDMDFMSIYPPTTINGSIHDSGCIYNNNECVLNAFIIAASEVF